MVGEAVAEGEVVAVEREAMESLGSSAAVMTMTSLAGVTMTSSARMKNPLAEGCGGVAELVPQTP